MHLNYSNANNITNKKERKHEVIINTERKNYNTKRNEQVKTVGIRAVNIRNSIQKNRHPVLLYALLDSFPIPR